MMIGTKGAARFHSNGFVAPGQHPGDAMDMTEGGQQQQPTAPNPDNVPHGTKRLASSREELEKSWQGASTASMHCVSNDDDSDAFEANNGRVKRRRTLQSSYSSDNGSMMECHNNFVRGYRISPDNRPPQASPNQSQVKAGWYEGVVDSMGNRHGRGISKHDDGTEYEGDYANDAMEGSGRYKFVATRHLIPNPKQKGSHLHRQVEKAFEGTFERGVPNGVGTTITKTVDYAPQAMGSQPVDVHYAEVVYDIGMHRQSDGKAVGEGVRIVYKTTNEHNRSTLEMTCYRLLGGENTERRVAGGYARWILQCMGREFPAMDLNVITAFPTSSLEN